MNTLTANSIWPWRPIYWEPVAGTGERIMVAVLHGFNRHFSARRVIRDTVLTELFGKYSTGVGRLIDHSLAIYTATANAGGTLDGLGVSIGGLHAGDLRETQAYTEQDIIRTACLLYSSMAQMDLVDEEDDSDAPQQSESNKRFGTEVKEAISVLRPTLETYFGRQASLSSGGRPVKFGFMSSTAIAHFTVLHPIRHSASIKDARARLWELKCASDLSGITNAVLIAAVPYENDATLGAAQRSKIKESREEIEREADNASLRWYGVHSAEEAAHKLITIAS